MLERVLHAAALLAFLAAVGMGFLAAAAPMLFPERAGARAPALRAAALLALVAAVLLGADWVLHRTR